LFHRPKNAHILQNALTVATPLAANVIIYLCTKSKNKLSLPHLRFTLAMVYNYTNQKKISELKNMRRPKHTVKMAITFVSILIEQHLLCKFKLGAKRFPAYDIFYLFPISRWFPLIWRWPGGVKKLHWGTRMLGRFSRFFLIF
jgi:hypothetical protein